MAKVYLSLGSNIDRERYICAALDALTEHFGELEISSVYESEAVGFEGENFLNLVVGLKSELSVAELNKIMRAIEHDNDRRRDGPKFSSRTLDIDILLYDDLVGEFSGVVLPRDEVHKNAFVLLPLSELAPDEVHPLLGKSYFDLWQGYDKKKQPLWAVSFIWRGQELNRTGGC